MKKRSKHHSISERIAANRDRQVEQVFSDLEQQIIRERLAVLAPDKSKQESGK